MARAHRFVAFCDMLAYTQHAIGVGTRNPRRRPAIRINVTKAMQEAPCRCPGMRFRGAQLLITTGVLWGGHQLASVQHKKCPAGPRQPPHTYT